MSVPNLWSPIEVGRVIEASPGEVFAVLRDPRTYPQWLDGAQRIRRVDRDFPRPGATFEHSVGPSEAVTVNDSSEVVAVERGRRLVLRVHVGPLDGTVELLTLPHPKGTEVRFREQPDGWGRLFTPALRLVLSGRNGHSLRQLEQVVLDRRRT